MLDLFTDLAASLSAGNPTAFLSKFDRKVPGYEKLGENVSALTRQADIESYVDVVRNEGDDVKRGVEASWKMRAGPGAGVEVPRGEAGEELADDVAGARGVFRAVGDTQAGGPRYGQNSSSRSWPVENGQAGGNSVRWRLVMADTTAAASSYASAKMWSRSGLKLGFSSRRRRMPRR